LERDERKEEQQERSSMEKDSVDDLIGNLKDSVKDMILAQR